MTTKQATYGMTIEVTCYYHRNGYAYCRSNWGDKLRLFDTRMKAGKQYTVKLTIKHNEK